MREIRRLLIILTVVMLLPVLCAGFAFAEGEEEEGTTYSIFVYSGKEGYFGNKSVTVKKYDSIKYGETVTIDLAGMGLKVKDPDKYYVRGLKIAGHDNDELSTMQMQSYAFEVKEDTSFSVSYGMAGGMVKYTVKYEDENGKKLRSSEKFYGMPGDKPVVAYRLIKGYLPNVINIAKRLSDDESDNVFTFTYRKAEGEDGEDNGEDGEDEDEADADEDGADADGTGTDGTGTNNNGLFFGSQGQSNGDDASDTDDDKDEDGITDLDEDEESKPDGDEDQQGNSKKGGLSAGAIAGIAGGSALLFLLILFLLRRKKNQG